MNQSFPLWLRGAATAIAFLLLQACIDGNAFVESTQQHRKPPAKTEKPPPADAVVPMPCLGDAWGEQPIPGKLLGSNSSPPLLLTFRKEEVCIGSTQECLSLTRRFTQNMKLYLDTSVLGAYYDKEFDEDTVKLFEYIAREDIKVVLSDILLEELQEAPENVRNLLNTIHNITYVEIDAETKALAKMYVKEGALEKKSLNDACHIAIATVTRTQVIVSCNFKHRSNSSKSSNIIALTYGKGTE